MPADKATLAKLRKFAEVFKAARDRNANESDTVMYLATGRKRMFSERGMARRRCDSR